MKFQHHILSLIIVDGLQSFAGYVPYQGKKTDIYSEILKRLKSEVAKELEVCVIVNSQLREEVSKRKTKRPYKLEDFSDCKGLGEFADTAIMIYRPEEYWTDNEEYRGWMKVIPVAMRDGDKRSKSTKLKVDIKTSRFLAEN